MKKEITKLHSFDFNKILIYMYALWALIEVFSRSMFSMANIFNKLGIVLLFIMFLTSLLFVKHSKVQYGWLMIGLIIALCIWSTTSQNEYMLIVFLLFSLSEVSPKNILKPIIKVVTASLFFIFIASKFNIVPNLIYERNGVVRQSLGMQFPLVFSAYVFIILTALVILAQNNNNKYTIKVSLILIICLFFLEKVTNSRNDELSILLLLLIVWCSRINTDVIKNITYFLITFFNITFLISIFITKFISYTNNSYYYLDKLLSGRIQMQSILFNYYSIRLFGNNILQIGLGGQAQGSVANYFYIDNSFTRFLFFGGIAFFIFIITTLIVKLIVLNNQSYSLISLSLLVVCINGIGADSLSILSTSLLLPLFLISTNKYKEDFYIKED